MLPFLVLPEPYRDCAIVGFENEETAESRLFALKTAAEAHGLTAWRKGAAIAVALGHETERVFSGIGVIGGRFVFGGDANPDGSEAGQFTCFRVDRLRVEAATDLLGAGHVFASQHSDGAIVSNRLHLHRIVMAALGFPVEVNPEPAIALLVSNTPFFAQQNMSPDMLIRGVRQVRVDEAASIVRGRLELSTKRSFLECLEPGDYEALVTEGVRDIIENARAALDDSRFSDIVVDLSGGRDSRIVLGAVLHHESWRQRASVYAFDVAGSRDLDIACGLANRLGAHFYEGNSAQCEALSLEDNTSIWRSYFHGLYHRMGAAAWSAAGCNTRTINLSGANGELLRSFWAPQFGRYLKDGDFSQKLVAGVALPNVFDREQRETVASYLARTLDALPGETLEHRLEAHYLYYRNRAHFGLRGFSFLHDHATWLPIASPHLLRAAWSLTLAERTNGKLIRDVLKRLDVDLLRIEFDGDKAPREIEIDCSRSRWETATAAARQKRESVRTHREPRMAWRDWPKHVEDTAVAAFEAIGNFQVPVTYVDRMRTEFASGSKRAFEMASRLMAISDSAQGA